MDNSIIDELYSYCKKNNINEPEYETTKHLCLYETVVRVNDGIHAKRLDMSEDKSKVLAAKELLEMLKNNSINDLMEKMKITAEQDLQEFSNVIDLVNNSSAKSVDEVDSSGLAISNPIGYLNELRQKSKIKDFDFEELIKSGNDPKFRYNCKITLCDGKEITAEGVASNKKEAKKISAEVVIRQMNSQSVEGIQKMINEFDSHITKNNTNNELDEKNSTVNAKLPEKRLSIDTNSTAITNPIGYLNEMRQKSKVKSFDFEDQKSGDDHCPTFQVNCKITLSNGREIIAKGVANNKRDAKKASAEEGIRQMSSETGEGIQKSGDELRKYFSEQFSNNSELNIYIESNDENNDCKKLEKIAGIIGCSVDYKVMDDKSVGLTLTIIHLNYILITTYGFNKIDSEVSKTLAAMKAIRILKVLNTDISYQSINSNDL